MNARTLNQGQDFDVNVKYIVRRNGANPQQEEYDWVGKENNVGWYPVRNGEKYGFLNAAGEIIVPIELTKDDVKFHLSDEDETISLPERQGYVFFSKNGSYGALKRDGSVAIDFKWSFIDIESLNEDLVLVRGEDKKWGAVNLKTGEIQVIPVHSGLRSFYNGYAQTYQRKQGGHDVLWGYIDAQGNTVCEPRYVDSMPFNKKGFATVAFETSGDKRWGVINTKGKTVIKCQSVLPIYFDDEYAVIYEGKVSVLKTNRSPRDTENKIHLYYDANTWFVIENPHCSIVNTDGEIVIEDCYRIDTTGKNTFRIISTFPKKSKNLLKKFSKKTRNYRTLQFVPYNGATVIIENAMYREYVDCSNDVTWLDGVYSEGGEWRIIEPNHDGGKIELSTSVVCDIRNILHLLAGAKVMHTYPQREDGIQKLAIKGRRGREFITKITL